MARVSDAINSVKRKEMLSCSAVVLHNKFDATFDSWKIQTVLRAGSRVLVTSFPHTFSREDHVSKRVADPTEG